MKTISITDDNGKSAVVSQKTAKKIETARKQGKKIYINRQYVPNKKWKNPEKLCQTNDTWTGFIRHSIWSVD